MSTPNIHSSQQIHWAKPECEMTMANVQIDSAELVSMIVSKNERGFHILYDRYCGSLYGILLKIVNRTEIADDLLQETFIKIWKHIERFDSSKGTLFTWMMNIARNIAIDYLRSSGHKQELLQVNEDLFSMYTNYKKAVDSKAEDLELKDFKNRALKLHPKYAEVIDMIFFNGCTHKQAAFILNLPLGTVKTRARKALDFLKMLYQQ